ncbi:DUF481 domain-containing protein [Prochlorococcus sp. MIT 1300]|uniref:DUF481 domain-containing protein n=1 Tax=Prochlorococcus sp. MIT 1300 TaxID=3096218 RepID=UPI002A757D92|nr:DUF481 domain-containing protein [Prochlorococcus sp. MIT 1300]
MRNNSFNYFIRLLLSGTLFSVFNIVTPAQANDLVKFKLKNGDIISGKLIKSKSTKQVRVLDHSLLGIVKVNTKSILKKRINKKWKTNIDLGIDSNSTGPNNSLGYALDISSTYKGKTQKLFISSSLMGEKIQEQKNDINSQVAKAGLKLRYDRIFAKGLSLYTLSDYRYNQLNTVGVNDISTSLGIGYNLIESDNLSLDLSIGPSVHLIDGGSQCSSYSSCGTFLTSSSYAADASWNINKHLSFLVSDELIIGHIPYSSTSNNFSTKFRYFPSLDSSFYTSISFNSSFQSIKDPKHDNNLKLQMGLGF